jgi:hypothetical protein
VMMWPIPDGDRDDVAESLWGESVSATSARSPRLAEVSGVSGMR